MNRGQGRILGRVRTSARRDKNFNPCREHHRRLKRFASALALTSCVFAPLFAHAEDSGSPSTRQAASEDAIVVLGRRTSEYQSGYKPDVVTTTGPWGGRAIEDLPYSITVLPSELIENSSARNLDQLFVMSPLVQAGQSQDINNIAQATLRGFDVARAYVNGVQNDNLGMGVFVEEIDQLEILNGLSGFLYGASPVGGVINYQLKRPTDYDLRNVTLGNYGGEQYYAHADLGGAFDDAGQFGYRLNLLAQDGDTRVDHQSLKRTMVSASADWRPDDRLVAELFLSRKDYDLDGRQFQFFLGGNVPDPLDGSRLYAPKDTVLDVDTDEAIVRLAYAPSDAWAVRASFAFKEDTRTLVYGIGSLLPDEESYEFTVYGGSNGSETNGGYLFVDREFTTGSVGHRLTFGVNGYSYVNNLAIQTNGFPVFFTDPATYALSDPSVADFALPDWDLSDARWIENIHSENVNAVIGDDITFNERWSMLVGVNATTIRSESFDFATEEPVPNTRYDETAVTPTVAVLYKPTSTLTTYVNYMEGLAPGAIVGPSYANANQMLEPLVSKQVELGAKVDLDEILLTAALFQIERPSERSDDGTMTGTYVQDGLEVHRGLELTASGKVTEELSVLAGLTVMDNEIRESANPALTGLEPNWVADTTAKFRAEYEPATLPGWTFTAGVSHSGERYQDPLNTRTVPSQTLIDVGARYETEILGRDVVARVNVMNVDDTRYWAATSPGTPRTVAFSLTASF